MAKPLVFISHSAKDPVARQILDKLLAALQPDFEVLLDQYRLEANVFWRRELDIWMSLCHAAVIIFSADALNSDWVLQEATILRWRRVRDENFVVIPVLIPPVNNKSLDANPKFAPLSLNEIQMLAAGDADEVVDRVVKRLEPLKARGDEKSALKKLEDRLISALSELETRNPQSLIDAAQKLGLTLPWRSDNKYSEQLGRALLTADFSEITEAVLVMAPHFSNYKTGLEILDRLSHFWVDPQAVARLPELFNLPQKQRAVCVNGQVFQFTPKSYLSRGRGDVYPWITANVSFPKGYEEQPDLQLQLIEQEVVQQILPLIGLDDALELDLFSGIADSLLKAREEKEPLFILVPEEIGEDVLEKLRTKFFRFTFFLLKHDQSLEPDKLKLRCIELLEPRLQPTAEEKAAQLYFSARGQVNSLKSK